MNLLQYSRRRYLGNTIPGEIDPGVPIEGLIGVGSLSTSLVEYPPTAPTTSGDYYVAPNGSDSNSGTSPGSPKLTIAAAIAAASSGQTILVRAGTYNISTALVVNKTNLKLWNYGTERPKINRGMSGNTSGTTSFGVRLTATGIHFKGFEIVGVPGNTASGQAYNSHAVTVSSNCLVEDVIVHSGETGSFYGVQVSNATFMDCISFACAGAGEGSNRPDCFVFTGPKDPITSKNCKIIRCLGANGTDDCMDLYVAEDCQIIDCVAIGGTYDYRNGTPMSTSDGNGFKAGGGPGSRNNTVIGCIAIGNYQQGIANNSTPLPGNQFLYNTSVMNGWGIITSDAGSSVTTTANNLVVGNATYDRNVTGTVRNNVWHSSNGGSGNSLPLTYPKFADTENGDFSLLPGSPAIGVGDSGTNVGASTVALALLKKWWKHSLIYSRFRGWGVGGTGLPGDTGTPQVDLPSSAPTGVFSISGDAQTTLHWPVAPSNVTHVVIERKSSGSYESVATVSSGSRSYTDLGLTNGTTYTYRLRWSNSAGNGSAGNEVVSVPWNEVAPLRGNPSFSAALLNTQSRVWHDRLIAQLSSPGTIYENGFNSNDLYSLGRYFMRPVFSGLVGLRATGDLRFLDFADYGMQVARSHLVDQGSGTSGTDGYRNWLWLANPSETAWYNQDFHVMDEKLTHLMVMSFAWACKQNRDLTSPGGINYGERADFWLDYLRNDFEPKWRARNNKPTQVPWMGHHGLTHPDTGFALIYDWFMWRLTGDIRYKTESDFVYSQHLKDVVVVDGDKEVFPLGANNLVSHPPGSVYYDLLETGYCQYMAAYLVTAFLEGNPAVTTTRLSRFANSVATYILDSGTSSGGSTIGGDVPRGGYLHDAERSTGMQIYIGMLHWLSHWDASSKLLEMTERFYDTYNIGENSVNNSIGMLLSYQLGDIPVCRNVVVVQSGGNVSLSWELPASGTYSPWDNVVVYHGSDPGSLTQLASLSATATSYLHMSPSHGTHYYSVAILSDGVTGRQTSPQSVTVADPGATVSHVSSAGDDWYAWYPWTSGLFNSISAGDGDNSRPDHIYIGNSARSGFLFSPNIPKDATITSAYVTLTPRNSRDAAGNITISAVDQDNASSATSVSDVDSHFSSQTSASVSWSLSSTTSGTPVDTPSLVTVLQELVSKSGWSELSPVVILFSGGDSGTAADMQSYENSPESTATLTVDYTLSSGMVLPPNPSTFYWQLQGSVPTNRSEQVYDIDGFDNAKSVFDTLKANGKYTIAYFSAGTWENWRSDANDFPVGVRGADVDDWAGEKWIDVRAISTLQPIYEARVQIAKNKGAHAIEWDNLDVYDNSSGFSISQAQNKAWLVMLSEITHAAGLAAIFKNTPDFASWAVPYFDGCIAEEAYKYTEIGSYMPWVDNGKPVWAIEYTGTLNCSNAHTRGIYLAKFPLDLDGPPTDVCAL